MRQGRSRRLDATVAEDRELLEELAEEFHPGMRVKAVHFEDYEGVVRFIGNTLLGPGPWIGIELDEPVGRSNGSIAGVFYFDCPEHHGAFVPPDCVEPIDDVVDPLEPPRAWDVTEHHYLTAARDRAGDAAHLAMSSPLAKFQAAQAAAGFDADSDYSGASHHYFESLPPKLRTAPAAGLASPSGARRRGGSGRTATHIMTRRAGDSGPEVGGTPPHLRALDALRSTVPYYEAFAPVHKDPEVGQRVRVKGHLGVVKFVGGTLFEFGSWVGVELDEPLGRNSGSVNGTFYFKCKPSHGIFVRPHKVEWVPWEFAPLPHSGSPRKRRVRKTGAALFQTSSRDPSELSGDDEEGEASGASGDGLTGTSAAPEQPPAFRSPSQGPPQALSASGLPVPGMQFEEVDGVLRFPSLLEGEGGAPGTPAGEDKSFFGAGGDVGGAHAILAGPHQVEFEFGCSDMKFYQLDSKIQGLFHGFFVGSAIGLLCEDRAADDLATFASTGGLDSYGPTIASHDAHRAQWYSSIEAGGVWGVDGDAALVLLDALVTAKGHVDHKVFAEKLAGWIDEGIVATGQAGPIGVEETLVEIVCTPEFTTHPLAAAKNVYFKNGKSFADNGAVARSPLLAISDFWDLDRVAANATIMAQVTHSDPRCVASCIAVNVAIALLLQKGARSHTAKGLVFVLKKAFKYAKAVGVPDEGALKAAIMTATPASLRLDDPKTCRHTYKALGAAFYALRTGTDFKSTLLEIAMCGGDADANCAVAGAVLGVKLGMWAVPVDWPPRSLPFTARSWPPVFGQFQPATEPENMPQSWLDLRGPDYRYARSLFDEHLTNLKLTIETYSTKRDY
ncbi:ADP-ribosylglycohydrolase superfamily protein [Thecamonas trahens ATCC 50062]|uniref:ADP-ribosylglycohydrolase superfamily protein n=1 Tax=Thecamonas trahens ATCC 50062 TaxID=461836 RepID=A0A0L0DEF5_THETB|nr:ADP-ribosylglycohydrolase superfamily protein [Thecamonas trahens ATCC 50062]KNC50575.1 ADP-ribosylglycohydrolase superfamily protein [Thecamonas trahens ATCC 50062]|eukprot:XP_013762465.1 ADP-ribosylglycohydrolase superfamily protein [Thecamonas trahens ATCC 50062]